MRPYEVIEHTADIGIRATGRSPEELFRHLAQGMMSLVVPPEQVKASETREIRAQAEGWETLAVAWLRELLYLLDARHFLGKEFRITHLAPDRIEAVVSGEALDPQRHSPDKELKAVTYCDLSVEQRPDGSWAAQVIFDI